MIDYTVVEKQVDTYLSNIINTPKLYYWIYIYPFYKTNLLLCSFFRYIQTFTCSVVHLSSLVVDVLWLGILNIVITFSISHWLIHVSLVLSLLHVKWEVLVVTIHIGCVSVGKSLVEGDWSLDDFIL